MVSFSVKYECIAYETVCWKFFKNPSLFPVQHCKSLQHSFEISTNQDKSFGTFFHWILVKYNTMYGYRVSICISDHWNVNSAGNDISNKIFIEVNFMILLWIHLWGKNFCLCWKSISKRMPSIPVLQQVGNKDILLYSEEL